jgi:hypothetical protein
VVSLRKKEVHCLPDSHKHHLAHIFTMEGQALDCSYRDDSLSYKAVLLALKASPKEGVHFPST